MAEKQQKNWLWTTGGRKFLGFLIATVALFLGRFESEWWVVAYAIYVGGNVAQKVLMSKNPRPEPYQDYPVGGTDE